MKGMTKLAALAFVFTILVGSAMLLGTVVAGETQDATNDQAPTLLIRDAKNAAVDAEIILDKEATEDVASIQEAGNDYEVTVRPSSGPVKGIIFDGARIADSSPSIGIDDTPEDGKNSKWAEIYAIDTGTLDFSKASATVNAKGTELYKCKDWNFTERSCGGKWVKVRDITPGEDYTVELGPGDPGFGEINATNAEHIDKDKKFVSNIYEETKKRDDVWSEPIYHDEYVRVYFDANLTNGNIINVYARNAQGSATKIEVYEEGSMTLLGSTAAITEEGQYNIRLSGMSGTNDGFLLKIVNADGHADAYLEFDFIQDSDWISPTSWSAASGWTNGANAYDGNTGTYASDSSGTGNVWGEYITLGLNTNVTSEKLRAYADFGYGYTDSVQVDVYNVNNDTWVMIRNGTMLDLEWDEMAYGENLSINASRFRWHYAQAGAIYWLYELQFSNYSATTIPTVSTGIASSTEENSTVMHGTLTSSGGETCMVRFEYGKNTSYGSFTSWQTDARSTGENFTQKITDLEYGVTYHYRAQANNSAGITNGTDSTFTTQNMAGGWVTPTNHSDPNNEWTNEGMSYDDLTDPYSKTKSFHNMDDPDGAWSFPLILNRSPGIKSDTLRFYAKGVDMDMINVSVLKDGIWTLAYSGAYSDLTWTNVTYAKGNVSAAMVQFRVNNNGNGEYWELYELDFLNDGSPNTALVSPADGNVTAVKDVNFVCNATDNSRVANITLYWNYSGTWQANGTTSTSGIFNQTTFTRTGLSNGAVQWNCMACDNQNECSFATTNRTMTVNSTVTLTNVTASPNPVKGGSTITITAVGPDSSNSGALNFYCSESSSTPNSSNTACTGGSTTDNSPPYSLSCTYTAASDDAGHQANCRAYDGSYYSEVRTANFTSDITPPSLTLVSVAGDTTATYYDNVNDGWTNITVNGESGMNCRWSTSDLAYASMSNGCDDVSGTQARCGVTTGTESLNSNWYVSCADSVGNGNTAVNNIDVTGVVVDWTAPATTDNSSTSVQLPGYVVAIIESDNLYGTASITTKYCLSAGCTPDTSIESGGTLTFSTRGQNVLRYNSSDPVGNVQTVQNRSININRLPVFGSAADEATVIKGGGTMHVTTISSDADGQTLKLYVCNSTSASSSGCGAGTYCSNTTASSNPSCSFIAESDNAAHDWYAFIYDGLGEGSTENFSGSYVTDSIAPTIMINSPTATTYAEASVAVDVTIGEGGFAWYSVDGDTNTSMSNDSTTHWTSTLSGLTDGVHRLRIYANDSVGNMNNTMLFFSRNSSLLDTNPPTLTVTAPLNNSYKLTSTVVANITTSETGNFSWYSLDGGGNITMDRMDSTHFGASLTGLSEGTHTLHFYANDSSGNTGTSSMTTFYVDLTPPRYIAYGVEPTSPSDNASAVCWSRWTDVIGLNIAGIADNVTDTNSNSSISGTTAWANRTLTAAQLLPRGYNCSITVYDSAGRSNTTGSFGFTVADFTPPLVHNISYAPMDNDTLDPGVIISVMANVSDEGTLDTILLEYKQANASGWSSSAMSIVSGNLYSGSFSPNAANTWIFRITANDSAGNTNSSTETSISVFLDGSWLVSPSDMGTKSGGISTNVSAGNLIINNTADYNQTFTISSNWANTFFNATTISLANGTSGVIAVSATTSGSVRQDTVTLTVTAQDATASPASRTASFTLVSYSNGPYLYVTVSAPDSVTIGNMANLSATVKNIGNASATGTTMTWSLPSGWTITSGSPSTSIGFLGINEQASASIIASVNSSAGTGTQTVTVQASSDQTSNSGSRNVIVSSAGGTTVQETTLVVSGGASGGGGSAVAMPTLSATAPANAAVQIGTEDGFPVEVTNTFDDNLANIRLEVSGFLSQYLSIEPATIALLKPGEVGQFIVKIKAPDYLSDQNFQLNITVHADRVAARGTTELTKSLATGLLLLAVAPEQVSGSLTDAEQAIKDVETAGLNAEKLQQLLADAQSAIASKNYADADRLVKEIMRLKEVALGTTAQLKTMEEKITAVHADGLDVPETERVVQLAKEAMARGDFDRAAARLGSASLTFALETKGQVNLIALSLHWWWLIALGSLVTAMGAATAWRELTLWRIGRGLSNMRREERSINELMGQTQAAYYHGQSIPKVDFYKTMYQYEKRLAEVHADFSRLVTQRAKLIDATDEAKRLDSEDAKIKRLIIELQKRYFEEGRMGKAAYERQMHELVRRRSELAEQHELVMKQGRQKMSRVARVAEKAKGLYNRAASYADRWVRGI